MPEPEVITAPEAAEEPNPQVEEMKARMADLKMPPEVEVNEEVEAEVAEEEAEVAEEKPIVKVKKTAEERIGDITKNYRTEERKNADLEKKLKDAEAKLAAMSDKGVVPIESVSKPEALAAQEKPPDIDAELESLWAEHEEASGELDGAKASQIFRKIHTLENKRLKEAATIKPEYIDKAIREKEEAKAVAEFRKNNTWFSPDAKQGANNPSYNIRKSNYAITVEKSLSSTFDGPYSELLKEVEREVEELFNPKKQTRAVLPSVAGVSTLRSQSAVDNTALTPIQKSFIQKSGMKEEDYRASLKKMGGTR